MGTIDIFALETEQVNFIRKSVTDPNTRTTNNTETFTATAGQTLIALTGIPSGSNMQHVNSVTVNGTTKTWGEDYVGIFGGANRNKIEFTSGLTLNDTVVVDYNYGSKDIAYAEFPRVDLPMSEYPRMSITFVYPTNPISASNYVLNTDVKITIFLVSESNYQLNSMLKELRDAYINNANDFYNIRVAIPTNLNAVSLGDNPTGDVVAKVLEVNCPFNYEKN